MKKSIIFLFSALFPFISFAQGPKKAGTADQSGLMFSGGVFMTDMSDVNSRIAAFGKTNGLTDYYITSGVHMIYPVSTKFYAWKGMIGWDKIITQETSAGDSMFFQMRGWHLMTSLFAKDVLRRKTKAALEFAPGIEWGKLKMRESSVHLLLNYKNVMIAPFFRIEFRYVYHRLVFGIRALYRYDITSPKWKCLENSAEQIGRTSCTGPAFQFFIGMGRAA